MCWEYVGDVLEMCWECFMDVFGMFQGVLGVLQGCLKVFQGCFWNVFELFCHGLEYVWNVFIMFLLMPPWTGVPSKP